MEGGSNEGRLILVSGATGQQGGAVARSLLDRGVGVRALTRNPEKPEARELADLGAEVVSGDLEDRASIDGVLEGVYGGPAVHGGRRRRRGKTGRAAR